VQQIEDPIRERRHEFEGGGVNALSRLVYTVKTLKFEKGGGVMTPPPTSYGDVALDPIPIIGYTIGYSRGPWSHRPNILVWGPFHEAP